MNTAELLRANTKTKAQLAAEKAEKEREAYYSSPDGV